MVASPRLPSLGDSWASRAAVGPGGDGAEVLEAQAVLALSASSLGRPRPPPSSSRLVCVPELVSLGTKNSPVSIPRECSLSPPFKTIFESLARSKSTDCFHHPRIHTRASHYEPRAPRASAPCAVLLSKCGGLVTSTVCFFCICDVHTFSPGGVSAGTAPAGVGTHGLIPGIKPFMATDFGSLGIYSCRCFS